jgi:hypothetical protein
MGNGIRSHGLYETSAQAQNSPQHENSGFEEYLKLPQNQRLQRNYAKSPCPSFGEKLENFGRIGQIEELMRSGSLSFCINIVASITSDTAIFQI